MSYDPSTRGLPGQERWPDATPHRGWPAVSGDGAYRDGDLYADSPYQGYRHSGTTPALTGTGSYAAADGGYGGAPWDGYGQSGYDQSGYVSAADDFDGPVQGYGNQAYGSAGGPPWLADDYADGRTGRGWGEYDESDLGHGQDGYGRPRDDFLSSAGYIRPQPSGKVLMAPDLIGDAGWPSGRAPGREPGRVGLIPAAMAGILAAAVTIGVATLVAAFIRPQASPVTAVGDVLIDRIPAALRNVAIEHFGTHGKTVLLVGVIALVALVIGGMARRSAAIGVAGLATLGLLGAFVVITRPASHATDVIPSIAGGIVGVIAFSWLARAAAPVAPELRPASGGRRTAR